MGPVASRSVEGEEGERPQTLFGRANNLLTTDELGSNCNASTDEFEIAPTPPPLPSPAAPRRHFGPFASHDESVALPPQRRGRSHTVTASKGLNRAQAPGAGSDDVAVGRHQRTSSSKEESGSSSRNSLDRPAPPAPSQPRGGGGLLGRKKTEGASSPNLDQTVQRQDSTKTKFRDTNKVREGVDDEGNKMINQYSMICSLGKGAYGKVKLAMDIRTNQPYAVKIMSKSQLQRVRKNNGENAMDDVRKEVAIMKKLAHKNVVRLYEVINDPHSDKIFLVLEYLPNGPITKVLSSGMANSTLPEDKARAYFRDALTGLAYLHAQGIIHRDIKPENLLLDADNCVKLTDFGVSQFTNGKDDTVDYMAGTPAFLAPEAISQERFAGKPCDIWALGVSLYALIFGCIPFLGDTYIQMYELIKTAPIQFPKPVSASLQDLFSKILDKDPRKRFTLPQIQQHPWVNADGEQPMEMPTFERLHVTEEDVSNAITKIRFVDRVALMVKVKSRFSKKAEEARERTRNKKESQTGAVPNDATSASTANSSEPSPLSQSLPDLSALQANCATGSTTSSPMPQSPLSASSWSVSTPISPQSQ